MPLPVSVQRQRLHTRRIECHGYRRNDGLWDIEGYLLDNKSYSFSNHDRGIIQAGEPVHEMWLRLTVNNELIIQTAVAVIEQGPFRICPQAAKGIPGLQGLRIGPGFHRGISARVGGTRGCTHLRELLGPMATTALQTVLPVLARERGLSEAQRRPALLGTCHAYAPASEVVRRLWPEHHRPDDNAES